MRSLLSALKHGIGSLRKGALFLLIILPVCGIVAAAGLVIWSFRSHASAQSGRVAAADVRAIRAHQVSDPGLQAYACWDGNEFFALPSASAADFNTLREGKVPAFSFGGATFVVLHKDRNWSRGVAIGSVDSARPEMKHFQFKDLPSGLMEWTYDPQNDG